MGYRLRRLPGRGVATRGREGPLHLGHLLACARADKNGDTGDVAVRHYEQYEDDLDLMAGLGLNAYRFSVSWPRVQPEGKGPFNERGIDYYKRVTEAVRARDLVPLVTLYHWDLPQALEDSGGWPARETALRFAEYAQRMAEALQDWVEFWVTLNEPSMAEALEDWVEFWVTLNEPSVSPSSAR